MKRIITSIIILLFSGLFSIAQKTKIQRVIGGTGEERNYSMDNTLDGGFITVGYSKGYGSGGADVYLVKTDGLGKSLWSKTYGTSKNETGWKVKSTRDSGFIIAGTNDGSTNGKGDGLIIKTDKLGNISWVTNLVSDSIEDIYSIIESKFGGFYAVGMVKSDTMSNEMVIAKITVTGAVRWSKTYGGTGDEEGFGITEAPNGDVFAIGIVMDDDITFGGQNGNPGDKDILVVRTDSTGNTKFIKNYGTDETETGWDIKALLNGSLVLTGWTQGAKKGSDDVFVAWIDTVGNLTRSFTYGTVNPDRAFSIVEAPNENLVVAGYTEHKSGDRDAFFHEITKTGLTQTTKFYGGSKIDGHWPTEIVKTRDGGFAMLSSTNTFGNAGSYDYYLLRTDEKGNTGCNETSTTFDFETINFVGNSYGSTRNYMGGFNKTNNLTVKTITAKDSLLCCKLFAGVAADTISICMGSSGSLGKVLVSGYKYQWTEVGGNFTSSLSNPSVSPTKNTKYKLKVSSNESLCAADSAFIFVKIKPEVKGPYVRDTVFCEGTTLKLEAIKGQNSYTWKTRAGTFSGQTIDITKTDTAYLTIIDNYSCIHLDTAYLKRAPLPRFNLGLDTTICSNLKTTLKGPAKMSNYNWDNGAHNQQNYTIGTERKHWLSVTDSFKCQWSDTIAIFHKPHSTFTLGPDTGYCKGSNFVIQGPGFMTGYIWNGTPSVSQTLSVNKVGSYNLTAFNSFGCPWWDTINIVEYSIPTFSLGRDTGVCVSGSHVFKGPSGGSYQWSTGGKNDTIHVNKAGSYSLTFTDKNSCSFRDTVKFSIFQNPKINLGPDTIICLGDSLMLNPGPFNKYIWSTGSSKALIYVKAKGTYNVEVTDKNGCKGFDEIVVDTKNCTGSIKNAATSFSDINVYPNPAKDVLNVSFFSIGNNAEISLSDLQGKQYYHHMFNQGGNHSLSIDLSSFSKGVYFVKFRNETGTTSLKVVLQ